MTFIGAVKYLGYADEHCLEPEEIMAINAGEFTYSPEKWHNIEVMTMIPILTSTFCRAGSTMEGATTKSHHSCRENNNGKKLLYTVTVTNKVTASCGLRKRSTDDVAGT